MASITQLKFIVKYGKTIALKTLMNSGSSAFSSIQNFAICYAVHVISKQAIMGVTFKPVNRERQSLQELLIAPQQFHTRHHLLTDRQTQHLRHSTHQGSLT